MRTGILALSFVVAGCNPLAKKADVDAGVDAAVTAADAVDAAPVPQPAVLATNQGDIARFPDESPIANVRATFMRAYNIRESPLAGAIILGLPKGAVVTQIAQRTTYVLIVFDNPKQAGSQLMGWVGKDAFSAVVADAGAPPTCPSGETALMSDSAFCGRICMAEADCAPGTSCRGSATRLGKTEAVKVCVALGPASLTTATPDGGAAVVADGGLQSSADAGPAEDVVAALPGSKCPGNFVFVKTTGKCHRPCTTSTSKTECRNNPYFCDKCDVDMKHVCLDSHTQCSAK